MSEVGREVIDICGQQFSMVEKGLDEAEVSAFVVSLIDQKNDLANKLGHLYSLTKLAEKTVVEAEEQARNIKIGAEEEAKAKAIIIITEAEEKAKAKAERIVTKAEEKARAKADRIIAEAEEKIKEEAENTTTKDKKKDRAKAEEIISKAKEKAKKEAERIIVEAQQRAEVSAREKISLAAQQAQNIVKDARGRAEAEVQLIRQEAERLLLESRGIAESQIRDIVARFTKACMALIDEASYLVPEERSDAFQPLPAPAVSANIAADTLPAELREQLADDSEKGDENETSALCQGTVELAIRPPTSADGVIKLHRHLEGNPEVKFLYMKGTRTHGVKMRVQLQHRTPLIEFLRSLPEVESALDRQKALDKIKRALGVRRQESRKTIEVSLAKMN